MNLSTNRRLSMKTQFFIKNLLIYCLLLLLPISVLLPFSVVRSNEEIESSIRKNNWNLLYQIEENMNSIFKQTDNINLYFAHNPSITTHLRRAFSEDSLSLDSLNSIGIFSVYLQNIVNTNDYIHSAYIYYNNDYGRFLASETARITNISGYYDTEWLDSYLSSTQDAWYEVRTLRQNSYSNPFKVISVYRRIYSSLNPRQPAGVIVVQISYDRLINYLDSLELSKNQVITFLDSNDQIILQSRSLDLGNILSSIHPQNVFSEKDSLYPVEFNGETYIASCLKDPLTNGWTYLSLIPSKELYASSATILSTALILTLAAILLGIVIAMIKANNDYRRLENILDMMNHPEKPPSEYPPMPSRSRDPYGYITRNLLEMFIQQNYLKIQISEKKYRMQVLEMQALQQQINPHFLFNTLHTIYWEAFRMTQSPNTCSMMVSNLSDIMEYSLGNSQEPVKLKEELDYLKAYVDIQKVRYGDKFDMIWEIDDVAVIYPICKMVLQPLVENALYHGIKEKEGSGVIKVKAYYRQDHVRISVLDNGAGMEQEQLLALRRSLSEIDTVESHIGLLNTHRRLVLTYGEASGIHIGSRKNQGTVISFRLPV